ncbi:hypothetical protein MHZ95_04025 [Sporosarcina sp. ACRSM]|uniref:hypothetical protein n=1 Tax=Sporosarcina sp. ACRSM TaxID=2918216 RepID=UPI001EF62A57|nr:hypothetical protein [Sporosarcina sp. ACRSM]MCG7334448.1 hypothetical protein [Sporosarcina sp. ACRSM]
MVRVKTPINPEAIKARAARKLSLSSAGQSRKKDNRVTVTGQMVKPIHVSKTDPLVRRIVNH